MNYIPGFSNYLETSVPRYAIGGRVMDGERMMLNEPMMYDTRGYSELPYGGSMLPAPAAQPMTQEAAPFDFSGLDLSGLNSLYGMNFGSNFGGGGAGGGIFQADPNIQYIGAPKSNKGNPTSKTGGNTFAVRVDQPVRLVDHRTNQVVFEGTGFDAARKATELGQGLTNQFGRKANYSIQTADPSGNYSTVAYEKKNKSTLGKIGSVAGTVLPLAMIPLTMGMSAPLAGLSTAGKIALGAGLGGLGSGLKGDNILKGAAMGGLSAAGGQLLGPVLGPVGNMGLRAGTAIGTGLGATAGGLATGQSLKNSLLGGVASGALSYVTPDIVKGLGINQGAPVSAAGDVNADLVPDALKGLNFGPLENVAIPAGVGGDLNVIGRGLTPNFSTPNVNLGGFKTPAQDYLRETGPDDVSEPAPEMPVEDIIKVTGQVPRAVTAYAPIAGFDGAGLSPQVINEVAQPAAETASPEEILVQARKTFDPVSISSPIATDFLPTGALPTAAPTETVSPEEILVEARKPLPQTSPGLSPEILRAVEGPVSDKPATDEIVVTGQRPGAVTPYAPIAGIETPMPDMSETDADAEAKKKLGLEEYLRIAGLLSGLVGGAAGGGQGQTGTYGGGGTGRLNPIFSAKLPAAGGLGAVGVNRTVRPMTDEDWLTYGTRPERSFFDYAPQTALPTPITTPIPDEPAGPSMYARDVDNMRFAEGGGAFAAKRGGSSTRTEFAVNGPGTGRSDDIPAVLSDGEYVIDAETVALLGDGSSKAGAKKLDDLRVKVRKHKGQKLAKGRFSANAKKPEAYLSGGRI